MEIMEIRALRGPNYYSSRPVIFMKLDIGELEMKPTDLISNFKENIELMMPTLYEHSCSPGRRGGFFERIVRGTWAGHVVEHVAIELQSLIGHDVTFGKTFTMEEAGIYNLVYSYIDENTALRAGEMAVEIVEKLFKGITTDIEALTVELKKIHETSRLGPSTQSIVNEAAKRGIPHIRLNDQSYVQLGQGKYQRRIQATMMDDTSALGVEIADDKARTKSILSSMGIPVTRGFTVNNIDQALKAAESIGYPVVVKPLIGNHGRGITINISDPAELLIALKISEEVHETSIVEKYLDAFDFRILVIDGKFVAAARREPAFVIGNGRNTIQELIEEINKDPQRGIGHEKNLIQIDVNYMTIRLLAKQNLKLSSILEEGKKIYVKSTANLSAGAIAHDVTETVHPLNILMAEQISRIIGLNVMGIDIIADTLEDPLEMDKSGVLEVNAAPGFRMHLNPTGGNPINIASNIVDMLFPAKSKHSVPTITVTGTNGKTTTTRIIAHILREKGNVVGMTSTDAVFIDDIPILKGDYSGPGGASKVMMDSTIDHAVLEVARGGILRRGLGFDESDVGILLNISSDHLGEGGITDLEKLTRLKSTVTEAVKSSGYAVFNADDSLVLSCIDRTKANPILFSKDPENEALKANEEKGNSNVTIIDNIITIQKKGKNYPIANILDIPISFDGKAGFNIENAMAAVAATSAIGLNTSDIKAGIISFNPSIDQIPGRMNVIDINGFKVVIDYGHNPGAIIATGDFLKSLMPGRVIRMASSVGNRTKDNILEYGLALSNYYDHIIICDPDSRERELGETAEIVKQGLLDGGFERHMISVILDERQATKAALDMAEKGDLVVLQVDDLEQVVEDVLAYKKNL